MFMHRSKRLCSIAIRMRISTSVYEQALPIADRLCLTEIDDTPKDADTFFPEYKDAWKESVREDHDTDEKHDFRYSFVDYVK